MLIAILIILFVLWLLGYGPFQVLSLQLIRLNSHIITLWDVLIFLVLIWLISALPSPIRQIASVLFVIWVLTVLGIIAIAGLSNLLIISIIVGLVIYLLSI